MTANTFHSQWGLDTDPPGGTLPECWSRSRGTPCCARFHPCLMDVEDKQRIMKEGSHQKEWRKGIEGSGSLPISKEVFQYFNNQDAIQYTPTEWQSWMQLTRFISISANGLFMKTLGKIFILKVLKHLLKMYLMDILNLKNIYLCLAIEKLRTIFAANFSYCIKNF